MNANDPFLIEFNEEMKTMRRALERVPDEKLSWQPHPRSMTMGRLATHLADIPSWVSSALEQDSIDVAPPGAPPQEPKSLTSRQAILELFDKNVGLARQALEKVADPHLFTSWSLLAGGNVLMTMPRMTVLRMWVMNHGIHHRAQLGVYLRLNDIPVPATYGPSADEEGGV